MRILVVQIGKCIIRHYNGYIIPIELIKSKYKDVEVDLLVCDKVMRACDFRGGNPDSHPNDKYNKIRWWRSCINCKKDLVKGFENVVDRQINLNDYCDASTPAQVKAVIKSLGKEISIKELLDFYIDGVSIGKNVCESIQRYSYSTSDLSLKITKGSIIYEYLYSAVLLHFACTNLFKKEKYSLLIGNEVSYVSYAVPFKVALKHKIDCLHLSWSYLGYDFLSLTKYSNEDSYFYPAGTPTIEEFGYVLSNRELFARNLELGKVFLKKFIDHFNQLRKDEVSKTRLEEKFTSAIFKKKNVVIYMHLCWDGTVSFGNPVFATFEEFYKEIFIYAIQRTELNFFFKLHPSEITESKRGLEPINPKKNSYNYIKELMGLYNSPDNIHILEEDNRDILSIIDICITFLGSIRYELPSVGIPVVVAECGIHNKDWDFLKLNSSRQEFFQTLDNIDALGRLTERQQEMSLAYAGTYFSQNRFIDTRPIWHNNTSIEKNLLKDSNDILRVLSIESNVKVLNLLFPEVKS